MAPNLVALLRRLADEYEQEEKGELSAAGEQRLAALEQVVAGLTPAERRDALEELPDEERQLILDHRAGRLTPPPPADEPDEPDEAVEPEETSRPRQQLTRLDIPRIWGGGDEADHVEYLDEQGKVKVRPGRKKGVPYEFNVEELPEPAADESGAA